MAVALVHPDEFERGRGKKGKLDLPFSKMTLSQARFVLRNCRDKALEVLRNAKYPLTVAYEEAQGIVEEQRLAEEERKRQLAALAVLREEFSDLAALVDDQRLGLPEAIAAGDQRREAARLKAEQEAREKAEKERREREEEERKMAEAERAKLLASAARRRADLERWAESYRLMAAIRPRTDDERLAQFQALELLEQARPSIQGTFWHFSLWVIERELFV